MSSSGTAFAPAAVSPGRNVLAHLLHALNQPLTGLQCSMELGVATSRSPEQHVRILREGLELTDRMRLLVETIRELTDAQQAENEAPESFPLDALVRETTAGLDPVAEEKSVRLLLECRGPLLVQTDRRRLAGFTFRLLESALSLARRGSDVLITTSSEGEQAVVVTSWSNGPAPPHSPFSRPELGLLLSRAGWEQASAKWSQESIGEVQTCVIRISLVPSLPPLQQF